MSHAIARRFAHHRASLLLLVLLLAGCATAPKVFVNEAPGVDLSRYATYGFVEEPDTDAGDYASLLTLYLQRAVTAELDARGYRFAEEPDLEVNFSVETAPVPGTVDSGPRVGGGFGVGRHTSGVGVSLGYGFGGVGREERTVTVHLVDAQRRQVVWQGVVVRRLRTADARAMEADLHEAVRLIFERFPASR